MSDTSNQRFLSAYMDRAGSPMFLSSFFKSPAENFHNTEKVGIDVRRNNPHIAIPVPSLSSGARRYDLSKYVNKEFTPVIYDDEVVLNAWDAMKRAPGEDPFQNPDFLRNAGREAMSAITVLNDRVRRGIELQASQVLQTGALSLKDAADNTVYELDFEAKTTHLVTTGTTWAADGATGDPLTDIENLAEVVRQDGKEEPTDLIFGKTAKARFLANPKVEKQFDKEKFNLGALNTAVGRGATKFGELTIGGYRFRLWTYNDTYIHPNTGAHTTYVATDKVIMLCENGRLDLTFGAIPTIVPPDARVQQFLPPRMSSAERAIDMHTTAWVTPNGKQLVLGVGTRALTIPTAIDTIACLDVVI